MNLEEMCMAAARYSDRYDEFEPNEDGEYEDDALHYFNVFRDAINEAYREVSRLQAMPDTYSTAYLDDDGMIDLSAVSPAVYQIKDVFSVNMGAALPYVFETKNKIRMTGAVKPGDEVLLFFHYIPESLVDLMDDPVFTEALVDPMVYISLAVARIWQSEKKMDFYFTWYNQYREHLKNVRSNMKPSGKRRIPRRSFR